MLPFWKISLGKPQDMSVIQAHPWISKLKDLKGDTQPAIGEKGLASLIDVPAMEEQKATAMNDAELFPAHGGKFW